MSSASRLTVASLVVGAMVVLVSAGLVPPRVRLGTQTIPCSTAVGPQDHDLIVSALCRRAGAYRLRALLGIAALLAALSMGPILIERIRPSRPGRATALWAVVFVIVSVTTVFLLAVVGTRHQTIFFDL